MAEWDGGKGEGIYFWEAIDGRHRGRAVMVHPWLHWSLWQQGIPGLGEILSYGDKGLATKQGSWSELTGPDRARWACPVKLSIRQLWSSGQRDADGSPAPGHITEMVQALIPKLVAPEFRQSSAPGPGPEPRIDWQGNKCRQRTQGHQTGPLWPNPTWELG